RAGHGCATPLSPSRARGRCARRARSGRARGRRATRAAGLRCRRDRPGTRRRGARRTAVRTAPTATRSAARTPSPDSGGLGWWIPSLRAGVRRGGHRARSLQRLGGTMSERGYRCGEVDSRGGGVIARVAVLVLLLVACAAPAAYADAPE